MIDYSDFFDFLRTTALHNTGERFQYLTQKTLGTLSHGDFDKWTAVIEAMPPVVPSRVDLAADAVTASGEINESIRTELKNQLMQLHPWRKGPFNLFGIHIDTEWRSDLKWARLNGTRASSPRGMQRRQDACVPLYLKDKFVLDVGCGNGYYLFRMLGAGAKAVVGVDPFLLYVMQFQAINRYIQTNRAAVLPLGADDVPTNYGCFDTVFSMGLLYHRRNAESHLKNLYGFLKTGGQLILETLVLDQPGKKLLIPKDRYAKMHNVHAISSPILLQKWLSDAGFEDIQIIDITKTTPNEQRKTDWMTFESLTDFLDPADPNKTIEGYPAPVRAILLAQKP